MTILANLGGRGSVLENTISKNSFVKIWRTGDREKPNGRHDKHKIGSIIYAQPLTWEEKLEKKLQMQSFLISGWAGYSDTCPGSNLQKSKASFEIEEKRS